MSGLLRLLCGCLPCGGEAQGRRQREHNAEATRAASTETSKSDGDLSVPNLVSANAPEDIPVGLKVEVLGQLGKGSFSVVWRVLHEGDTCALKIVQKDAPPPGVEHEVECGKRLESAPGVVRLLNYFHNGKVHGLLFEYMPGGQLFDHIVGAGSPHTEHDVMICFERIAEGMQQVHEAGVVHRDLKPENLLIAAQVDSDHPLDSVPVKIADFGLSFTKENPNLLGAIVGTPGYIAPEVCRREKEYDESIDVFSLGSILFEMLVGVSVWDDDTIDSLEYANLTDEDLLALPNLDLLEWKCLSHHAQHLILSMLRQDPKSRPKIKDVSARPWHDMAPEQRRSLPRLVESVENLKKLKRRNARKRLKAVGHTVLQTVRLRAIARSHLDVAKE